MKDTNNQKKIFELCEGALSCEPNEREAYLESATNGDDKLMAAVKALLQAVDDSGDFLEFTDEQWKCKPGDSIGAYQVVRQLGAGGMGNVYLAERDVAGYSQSVALKILRTHLRSVDMIARFNEERRILARLNHPYIAHQMDGGSTEQGLPFLVMELVEGVPIDEYCDNKSLTINARLQLIEKVALAIQSAHQNLVVHSDLKPANILITEDGIPKLLDFGIAKLVRRTPQSEIDKNKTEKAIALTPDYASPEQLSGAAVTTASDIYSLGVLTYKLLVGETPYQVDSISSDELATTMASVTIAFPSTRVRSGTTGTGISEVARRRSTTPVRLARRLTGDVDAVLIKALAKDPQNRYVSASAFADDLMRCRKGLPVAAHADTTRYRLGKFAGRHRISVVAGCLALMALFAGLGVSLWQAHIAKQRFDDLHGFAETMIYDLHDEIADLPGATKARQQLIKEALHYLDRLAQDAKGDRDLQLNLSMAYKRMGDVLGNPNNANLGNAGSALDSYQKALAIAGALSHRVSKDASIERHIALIYEKMADVLAWQGDMDVALEYSERSLSGFQSLLDASPENDKAVMTVAISHVKRGDLLGHPSFPNAGDPVKSLAHYRNALEIIEPLARSDEGPDGAVRYLALIHERIGTMLAAQPDYAAASEHFETSLHLREQLAAKYPTQVNNRRDVAIAFEKLADVSLARGDLHASLPNYEKALGIYRSLAKDDPENSNAMRTLAIGLENLGEALLIANDLDVARARFDEALTIRRDLIVRNPDNKRFSSEFERVVERINTLQ